MTTKKYDAVIKTGSYTNAQGEEKGRYQNVGALLVNDEGREFLVLEPWFNPAGAMNKNGQVFVSLFVPKQRQQTGQGQAVQGQQETPSAPAEDNPPVEAYDDPPF